MFEIVFVATFALLVGSYFLLKALRASANRIEAETQRRERVLFKDGGSAVGSINRPGVN